MESAACIPRTERIVRLEALEALDEAATKYLMSLGVTPFICSAIVAIKVLLCRGTSDAYVAYEMPVMTCANHNQFYQINVNIQRITLL